jgi:hypothetical protein
MSVIDKNVFFPASQYRNYTEGEFLTTSSLPYFIGEKFLVSIQETFPMVFFNKYAPKDTEVSTPGITYRIYRRTPGLNKIDPIKPSLKSISLENGSIKHLYTQYQTVTYEFVIYGLDTDQVDDLVETFESFLFQIQPELQKRNVQHFIFEEEVREDFASLSKKVEEQYKRVLRYTAAVQKPYYLDYGLISSILIQTGLSSEKVSDIPLFRGQDSNIDVIGQAIDWEVLYFKSVSSLKDTDLWSQYRQAEVVSGSVAANNYIQQFVYIPDVDYVLYSTIDPSTGQKKKAIVWADNLGSKKPDSNSLYYISWMQPIKVNKERILK